MTIEFQFTLDDYRNAFRAHFSKGASPFTRWTLRLGVWFGAFLLLIGIVFVITGQRTINVLWPPFLLGALWIWLGMGGSYRFSARNQFTKNPSLRQPRRVDFNQDGLKTDAGVASSQHSWKAYVRCVESNACFLLYTSPACFNIIPKRALQPEQLSELRQLLQANIGKELGRVAHPQVEGDRIQYMR
jgi:hypothetical protein